MTGSRFTTWTFVLLFLMSLVMVIHLLFGFFTPVILAMVFVSIFHPLYSKLLRRLGNREYVAASIATALIVLGVLIPLTGFFILLVQQAMALFKATDNFPTTTDLSYWMTSLKGYLETLNGYLQKFGVSISTERIIKAASSLTQSTGAWFYDSMRALATNVLSLTINFILMVALVFVFFVSGPTTKHFIMELIPLPVDEKERVAKRFRELALAVFVGNGLICVLQGAFGGLSFFIFGIEGGLIWGVMITVTALLPLVGSAIILVPAALYLVLNDQMWQAITFLLVNTMQIALLETLVKPRLIGTKSQMPAALVFMSILAGMQIYGILGLFYGPLLVTIFLALAEIYREHYRDRLLRM